MSYNNFIESKRLKDVTSGFQIPKEQLNRFLKPFQASVVNWALQRGRAAIFASTGLGKALMALEWAIQVFKQTGKPVIILTPLAVAEQTVRESKKFGVGLKLDDNTTLEDLINNEFVVDTPIKVVRCNEDVIQGINVCNYEMLHKIDCREFSGVALDESSILKNFSGTIRNMIIDTFAKTPYRLSLSATPAPNDYMELGNQAQFLGILSYHEMLSMFFIHDSGETSKWSLKKHGQEDFWNWMCTWAVNIRKPSDIGFDDEGYNLLPLNTFHEIIETDIPKPLKISLKDASRLRRETIDLKVKKVVEIISKKPDEFWVVWCGLNDESKLLAKKIEKAIELTGSESVKNKEEKLLNFSNGKIQILVSKPEIAGFGLNWQHCHNTIFCGIDYSFESEYQAIRRFWRFGQQNEVNAYIVLSDAESGILEVIKNKENAFEEMFRFMSNSMKNQSVREIEKATKLVEIYNDDIKMVLPNFLNILN